MGDADGRQCKETLGREADGWTERRADRELGKREEQARRGVRRPRRSLTFADYAERWFEEGPGRRAWKPGTIRTYEHARRSLVERFGPMPLAAIRPRHVAEYVAAASERLKPGTVNLHLSVLGALLRSAVREELIESSPAAATERPKVGRRRWRILSPSEAARLAREFGDERMRVVFLTLVLTGLRRHELRNLRWGDVDLVENILRVRDSKSESGRRSIALPSGLAEELWQLRRRTAFQGDDEYVFCHPERGSHLRAEAFAAALRDALDAAGIPDYVRPFHDLRHAAITNNAAAGASPIGLMTWAGHSDMKTTKQYIHLSRVVFREEAEALERRMLSPVATSIEEGR